MSNFDLNRYESLFAKKIKEVAEKEEPAHDFLHFLRVVKIAKALCETEKGQMEIVVPAAWLHDLVIIPKNDPRRSMASRLSGQAAKEFLTKIEYPEIFIEEIAHAVEAHSFSANIPARTLEAKIVQDADRLDGLGAIGIARCFAVAGGLRRAFYSEEDPLCESRVPDDRQFTIDHFFVKLFKTANSMQTKTGQIEGKKRAETMRKFLLDLKREIAQ